MDTHTKDFYVVKGVVEDDKDKDKGGIISLAWGRFDRSQIPSTGWGKLSIDASDSAIIEGHYLQSMYAMGVLEGYLTCTELYQFHVRE